MVLLLESLVLVLMLLCCDVVGFGDVVGVGDGVGVLVLLLLVLVIVLLVLLLVLLVLVFMVMILLLVVVGDSVIAVMLFLCFGGVMKVAFVFFVVFVFNLCIFKLLLLLWLLKEK